MISLVGPESGEFIAGNDHAWTFDVQSDGEPLDLTGMTCRFVMGRDGYADALSTESSPPTAVATVDSPPNSFTVEVAHADTQPLIGSYPWQAQVIDLQLNRSAVLRGWFTFRPSRFAD
jgi:hypothetical protein